MRVCGKSFAGFTKVGVKANRALVADAGNVRGDSLNLAERAIAEDTAMDLIMYGMFGDRPIDRDEPMTWMSARCILNARPAIVPVRAGQAFMANANDSLVTAIADRCMLMVPPWTTA